MRNLPTAVLILDLKKSQGTKKQESRGDKQFKIKKCCCPMPHTLSSTMPLKFPRWRRLIALIELA
jgi:hypothetical protein